MKTVKNFKFIKPDFDVEKIPSELRNQASLFYFKKYTFVILVILIIIPTLFSLLFLWLLILKEILSTETFFWNYFLQKIIINNTPLHFIFGILFALTAAFFFVGKLYAYNSRYAMISFLDKKISILQKRLVVIEKYEDDDVKLWKLLNNTTKRDLLIDQYYWLTDFEKNKTQIDLVNLITKKDIKWEDIQGKLVISNFYIEAVSKIERRIIFLQKVLDSI